MTTTTSELDTSCAVPDAAPTLVEPALVPAPLAAAAVAGGALLFDVRSAPTRERQGGLPQARLADRTRVAEQFGEGSAERFDDVTSLDQPIVVICGSENGSRPVAEELLALGFTNVVHVAGGFPAWAAAGLPATAGAGQ